MPLVGISLSFIAGIIFESLISLPPMLWLVLPAVVVTLIVFFRFVSSPQPASINLYPLFSFRPLYYILFIAFLLGVWRYRSVQPDIDAFHIAFYNDRSYEMLVTGTLAEPPDYRDTYTNLK